MHKYTAAMQGLKNSEESERGKISEYQAASIQDNEVEVKAIVQFIVYSQR